MQKIKTAIMMNPQIKADDKVGRPDIIFSPDMDNLSSAVFSVINKPYIVRAYNLFDNEYINVIQVSERGEAESPIFINGKKVQLTNKSNLLVLDIPGRYKFELEADHGSIWLIGQESAMTHWTCGLIDLI